jgi:gamma-glutamylcyclotransferase (GGCT)/AIG2-like uncharacterized protein YtfP
MNPDRLYAFYGSLRKGMLNHRRYASGLDFLYQESITGYRLYAMDDYPYAVKTGNKTDIAVVEVFRIVDPEIERAIHDLELSVGYYYDEVAIRGKRTGIYLFKSVGPEPLVENGDWVKFFGP